MDAGASGNVLINEDSDRLNSYTVWDYAAGRSSYSNAMLVDLTQFSDNVSDSLSFHNFVDGAARSSERKPARVEVVLII